MKIDVHTHIVPAHIADRVLQSMEQMFHWKAPYKNTLAAIKAHMREAGTDKSIVLGMAQEARHVRPANDWLISIADEQLVPFGAMHPDYPDQIGEIRRLRGAGIKGIKLQLMVNQFYIDDPRLFALFEEIGDTMVVLTHAGKLHADRDETLYAAPYRILHVLQQFPKLRLIAAHLGGFYMLDEAERTLVGHPQIYIDTTWPPSIGEVAAKSPAFRTSVEMPKSARRDAISRARLSVGIAATRVSIGGVLHSFNKRSNRSSKIRRPGESRDLPFSRLGKLTSGSRHLPKPA